MKRLGQKELDTLIPSLCTRCGKCCLNEDYMGTLYASDDDVKRWRKETRRDILNHVSSPTEHVHDIWVKDDGECSRCPFLRKDRGATTFKFRIYNTRPEPCRDYPNDYAQMERAASTPEDGSEKTDPKAGGTRPCSLSFVLRNVGPSRQGRKVAAQRLEHSA